MQQVVWWTKLWGEIYPVDTEASDTTAHTLLRIFCDKGVAVVE
jgi:hypothetical protein